MSTYYSYLFPLFFLFLSIPVFSFLGLSFLSSILLFLATLLSLFFIRDYLKISPCNFFWSILSFMLILSGLLTLGWLEPYSPPRLFGQEFCLAYLQQGTLYTENPYCVQGPITYVVAYLIRFVFSDDNFALGLLLFSLLSLSIVAFFLYKIKYAYTKDTSFFFLLFLFLFVTLKEFDFATTVALFFLIPGFLLFYYTDSTYLKFLGSFLFAFSLLSKSSTLFLVGPAFLFMFLRYKLEQKQSFLESFRNLFYLSLPLFLLYSLVIIKYPNFLTYYYGIFADFPPSASLFEVLYSFFLFSHPNAFYLLLYLALLIVIIRLFSGAFDVYSFICGISFPLFYGKAAIAFGLQHVVLERYFFLFFPFYIILLYKIKVEFPLYSKAIKTSYFLILTFLLFLSYPFFSGFTFSDFSDGSLFNTQKMLDKVRKEVSYPFYSLPQVDSVLVGHDYTAYSSYPLFLHLNKSDFLNVDTYRLYEYDTIGYELHAQVLVTKGLISSPGDYEARWQYDLDKISTTFSQVIFQQENTSIIILSPKNEFLYPLLRPYTNTLSQSKCLGYFPFLWGNYLSTPYTFVEVYLPLSLCQEIIPSFISYYKQNIDLLCSRSEVVGNNVLDVLELRNGISLGQPCSSSSKTFDFFKPQQLHSIYLLFFLLLFLFSIPFRKREV